MIRPKRSNQKGFTIIELLVATTVFSVVLIVFLTAFLRISQLFYKGVNMANTQEAARNIVQDVSDDLQFYQQAPTVGVGYFCIGIHRYTYNLGTQVGPSSHGIVREVTGSGCQSPAIRAVDYSKAEELLDPGMQVNWINLSSCGNSHCTIAVHIVFYGGDNSVLVSPSGASPAWQAPDAECSGPASSSQYCATADYKSTVLQNF